MKKLSGSRRGGGRDRSNEEWKEREGKGERGNDEASVIFLFPSSSHFLISPFLFLVHFFKLLLLQFVPNLYPVIILLC